MKAKYDRLMEEVEEVRSADQKTINRTINDGDIYTLMLHYNDKVLVYKHSTKQDIAFPKDVTVEEIITKLKGMK